MNNQDVSYEDRVSVPVDVNVALVEEVVEEVDAVHRRLAVLLVPEDEVDPLVQVLTDVVALQRLSVNADELARVLLGPRRQHHVAKLHAILLTP